MLLFFFFFCEPRKLAWYNEHRCRIRLVSVAHSGFCLGVDKISSSEEEVSSVSSEEETPPCSPPPEDSRCEYRIDRQ